MENIHLGEHNVRPADLRILEQVTKWLRLRDKQESAYCFRFSATNAANELSEMIEGWKILIKKTVEPGLGNG